MSTNSYSEVCPKCGGHLLVNHDNRPYDRTSGECLNCGFVYYSKEDQMELNELNELRADYDMKPLKKLPVINLD